LDLYPRKMGWLLGPELSELILPWRVYYGCGIGFRISTMSVGKRHGKNFFRGQSQYWGVKLSVLGYPVSHEWSTRN